MSIQRCELVLVALYFHLALCGADVASAQQRLKPINELDFSHAHRTVNLDPIGIEVSHLTGRIFIGPDPEKTTGLFRLLERQYVREDLKLDPIQTTALADYEKAEQIRFNEAGRDDGTISDLVRQDRRDAIEEILTPAQMTRLKQIAYRLEVSSMGLAHALTEGRLATQVGVYENQVTRILTKGEQAEIKRDESIAQLRKSCEEALIAELKPEQRRSVREAIGDYFLFDRLANMDAREKSRYFKGPDPENESDLFMSLIDSEVALLLSLNHVLRSAIADIVNRQSEEMKTLGMSRDEMFIQMQRHKHEREIALNDILEPVKLARLKQLTYRREISARGLEFALTEGYLRGKAMIGDDQATQIAERSNALNEQLKLDIRKQFETCELEVLQLLTLDQRRVCQALIGEIDIAGQSRGMRETWLRLSADEAARAN